MQHIARFATVTALALGVSAPVHAQQLQAAAKQVMIEGVGAMELTSISASIEAVDVALERAILRPSTGQSRFFLVAIPKVTVAVELPRVDLMVTGRKE